MLDWRRAADYGFAESLTRAEWAWQFLRRNPDYRRDYAWFSETWQALEADYGAPPQRDFFRWKQDPRAWRAESEIAGCAEACPGEGEQVLIECWMGAKWGLRKFPLDPSSERPVPGEALDWREQAIEVPEVGCDDLQHDQGIMALAFDLALPLAPQLEAARIALIGRQRALDKRGSLPPRTLRAARAIWTRYLRLLDAQQAGAAPDEMGRALGLDAIDTELAAAWAMARTGYRRILLLDD
ncbi:MAG: hypothetical protein HXY26_04560 [Hydrogenophilaceae bacterium]|nr:hypothetical protein [Hydrogenophilaceae bacterium]